METNVVKQAQDAAKKHVPAINTPLVTEEQILNTISQLDIAVSDMLKAGKKQEETYQNKAELVRAARKLETSIKLVEAEAVMEIVGTGKDAYGMVKAPDGRLVKMPLTNDTQRDAYRRIYSAEDRKELAKVEADLRAIEVAQVKAKEDYDAKKEAVACIRAKAALQAAALNYLA